MLTKRTVNKQRQINQQKMDQQYVGGLCQLSKMKAELHIMLWLRGKIIYVREMSLLLQTNELVESKPNCIQSWAGTKSRAQDLTLGFKRGMGRLAVSMKKQRPIHKDTFIAAIA